MEIKAISFTGKTPRIRTNKKAYNEALARVFGQSDKDYRMLTQKTKAATPVSPEKFIENAKKFFKGVFGQ